MDGVSTVASVIAVVQITQAVGKALRDFYRDLRDARSEIEQLYDSVVSLETIAKGLESLVAKSGQDMMNVALLEDPEGPLKKALKELQSVKTTLGVEVLAGSTFQKIKLSVRKELRRSIGWPFKKGDVMAIVQRLESHRNILMMDISVNTLHVYKQIGFILSKLIVSRSTQFIQSDILQDIKSEIHEAKADSHRAELIKWISKMVPDPSIEHNIAVKKHEETTGSWLVEGHDLERWKTSPNSCLWIHGNAGAGKSILFSTVIDYIQESCRNEPSSAVAYWYFSFRSPESQKVDNLLRSLVTQLCNKLRDAPQALRIAYEKANSGLLSPSTQTILGILKATLEEFEHVYIMIDALDECPRTGRDQEFGNQRERNELLEHIHELCSWDEDCLHFFATSRKEGDIEESMSHLSISQLHFTSISVQGAHIGNDIRKYIHRKLNSARFKRWTPDFKLEVELKLTSQADGMWVHQLATTGPYFAYCTRFRLVALQLDILLTSSINSISAVRKILNDLPRSLDTLYDQTLTQIPEEDQHFASLALKWIAYAVRPLSLKEISEAIIISSGKSPCLDEDDRFMDEDTILRILPAALVRTRQIHTNKFDLYDIYDDKYDEYDEYRNGLKSKSELRSDDRRVTIVEFPHFSVFEYLRSTRMSSNLRPIYQLEDLQGQRLLAESCLLYILHIGRFGRGLLDDARKLLIPEGATSLQVIDGHFEAVNQKKIWGPRKRLCEQLDSGYPLATYAYSSWHIHLVPARYCKDEQLARLALEFLDFKGASWIIWLGTSFIDNLQYTGNPRFLYQTFDYSLDCIPGHQLHPVTSVSRLGLSMLLDSLLQENPNVSNICTTPMIGTPLHAASYGGQLQTVQVLLARGADANMLVGGYSTPLIAAIKGSCFYFNGYCNLDVLKLLVQSGAKVNTTVPVGMYGSALTCAAELGKLADCQFLIESGADVNILGGDYGTPLIAASRRRHPNLDLVKLLVQSGAKVNMTVPDGMYGSALTCAAELGKLAVCQFLIESGADVNILGGDYGTPLIAASWSGFSDLDLVKLLVQSGAKVNTTVPVGMYGSALTCAAKLGKLAVCQFLIESGADVNIIAWTRTYYPTESRQEFSPLAIAVQNRHLETAKLLLTSGASLNQRPEGNMTPWQEVCSRGSSAMLKLFLQFGADPNDAFLESESVPGWEFTPLHAAAGSFMYRMSEAFAFEDVRMKNTEIIEAKMKIKLLLEAGADANKKVESENYGTALRVSMWKQRPQVMKILLDAGAELDPKDDPKGVYQIALREYNECDRRDGDEETERWHQIIQVLNEYYAKIAASGTAVPAVETPELEEIAALGPH